MTDAWSDRKRRSIMNLCTNCADRTSFISSKEMSDVSHTSEVIFELVDKAIKDIGPDNVVQVVTDNASNNMGEKNYYLRGDLRSFGLLVQLTQST
jgi:type III secretory pathway lipoprotein EscJ